MSQSDVNKPIENLREIAARVAAETDPNKVADLARELISALDKDSKGLRAGYARKQEARKRRGLIDRAGCCRGGVTLWLRSASFLPALALAGAVSRLTSEEWRVNSRKR